MQHTEIRVNVIFESDVLNAIRLLSNFHWGGGAFSWVDPLENSWQMTPKSLRTWTLKLRPMGSAPGNSEAISQESVEESNVILTPVRALIPAYPCWRLGDDSCFGAVLLSSVCPSHPWVLLTTPLMLGKLVTPTDHLSVIYATSLHWFLQYQ